MEKHKTLHTLVCLLGLCMMFTSCRKESLIDSVDILWETRHNALTDSFRFGGHPFIVGPHLYLLAARVSDDFGGILKFEKGTGAYVGAWKDPEVKTSFYNYRPGVENFYVYGDDLFYVIPRYGKLAGIDLNSMTSKKDIPYQGFINHKFIPLGNKLYFKSFDGVQIRVMELSLDDFQTKFLYALSPGDTSVFAVDADIEPYEREDGAIGLCMASPKGESFTLINYHVTEEEVVYEIPLEEFGRYNKLRKLQVFENKIYLSSNGHLSCRDLQTGELLWERYLEVDANYPNPIISDKGIFHAGRAIESIDPNSGNTIWRIKGGSYDLAWGSLASLKVVGDKLFFENIPISIATGGPIKKWNDRRDQYGLSTLPFGGLPGFDEELGLLYFSGYRSIFCLEMP